MKGKFKLKENVQPVFTHRGILKFNPLTFGIKVAPAIFQLELLSELDFVVAYQDDIMLKNENPEEYKKMFNGFWDGFKTRNTKWKKKNTNY